MDHMIGLEVKGEAKGKSRASTYQTFSQILPSVSFFSSQEVVFANSLGPFSEFFVSFRHFHENGSSAKAIFKFVGNKGKKDQEKEVFEASDPVVEKYLSNQLSLVAAVGLLK
jgi:hypothetical protein